MISSGDGKARGVDSIAVPSGGAQLHSLVDIQWQGPFTWSGDHCVFERPEASAPGIYIWTIPFQGGDLVYYVGETGRSFAERLKEHARDYLAGIYRIYDAAAFSRGEKLVRWHGLWLPGTRDKMGECIQNHSKWSPLVDDLLSVMRIYLGPTTIPKRLRLRVEAGIALALYGQPDIVGSFQDIELKLSYRPGQSTEEPVTVRMTFPKHILGLPDTLTI